MRAFYVMLAISGWVWLIVAAIYLVPRLWKRPETPGFEGVGQDEE